jgi:phosphopantothenoylcysteine decarboxylase/phosphopantothenate--cysteine ligase
MKFVISAGPTREYIDRVRYLSNESSGRMGYELARSARQSGHKVILVSGPTCLKPPQGVRLIRVVSADEMYRAVSRLYPDSDVLIMASAVSDYKPLYYFDGKLKKEKGQPTFSPLLRETFLNLKLTPTIDILECLGRKKAERILIGFALEVENKRVNALKKLHQKNLDYIVSNSPLAFGKTFATVEVLNKNGLVKRFVNKSKRRISDFIIQLAERAKRMAEGV